MGINKIEKRENGKDHFSSKFLKEKKFVCWDCEMGCFIFAPFFLGFGFTVF